MEVVDPATRGVLSGEGSYLSGVTDFLTFGSFTVPASGTVVLRFRRNGTLRDDLGMAPYAFFVRPGP